jgi:RNA polymerase sigma-70 factor (ECF subfamily)
MPRPPLAERLDGAHYRDDVLRLLFICCHPDLPATQQIALALRIVSGLTVPQIARAFPGRRGGDGAAHHPRQGAHRPGRTCPFEAPSAAERPSVSRRRGDDLSVFNEGYSAGARIPRRGELCGEAIRLARLLLRLFQTEPEIMGLTALMLLQHARAAARFDAAGEIVLLDDQDRASGTAS